MSAGREPGTRGFRGCGAGSAVAVAVRKRPGTNSHNSQEPAFLSLKYLLQETPYIELILLKKTVVKVTRGNEWWQLILVLNKKLHFETRIWLEGPGILQAGSRTPHGMSNSSVLLYWGTFFSSF